MLGPVVGKLYPLYLAIGALLLYAAVAVARDAAHPRRTGTAAFWGLLGVLFVAGDFLPTGVVGAGVVLVAVIAGFGGLARGAAYDKPEIRTLGAARLGHRLFVPALLIPLVTVVAWFVLKRIAVDGRPLLEPQQATLYALMLACIVALLVALRITRSAALPAFAASHTLLEAIGWAAVLPLVLAMLGGVFARAGVGELIAAVVGDFIPVQSRFACVLAYALGMAAFTMVMGNAFAAFPVMTAGVALPLLVQLHGADPAPLAAIGMLSGYCGTLLTPMAANYNIVPAALLELSNQYAVIRQQIATGLLLLATNAALMNFLVFR